MKLKTSLKPISLAVASLVYVSSVWAAGEREEMTKGDETKSRAPVINKPIAVDPAALLNATVMPVAPRPAATQLALHEPVVKMPEMTIGGKVKPPAKQTEMERYRLPQTTESITRERIDNTINLATPEDAIKYMPSVQVRSRYIGDTNAPVMLRSTWRRGMECILPPRLANSISWLPVNRSMRMIR